MARRAEAETDNTEIREAWIDISLKELTRLVDDDPTNGRFYHSIARRQTDRAVHGHLFQFVNHIKSLVVRESFTPAFDSLFALLAKFVAPDSPKLGEQPRALVKLASADESDFFTAATHLVLAMLAPKRRDKNGYCRPMEDHLEAFRRAMRKLYGIPRTGSPSTSPLRVLATPSCMATGARSVLRRTTRPRPTGHRSGFLDSLAGPRNATQPFLCVQGRCRPLI